VIRVERFSHRLPTGAWSAEVPPITISAGEVVSIIGPSGSGKTKFCLLAAGFGEDTDIRGSVSIGGRSIWDIPEAERAQTIAYVPTDPTMLFSGVKSTVEGELALGWQILSSERVSQNITAAVELFRLGNLLTRDPFTLSGGEAARTAVALAVLKQPQIVIIDQAYEYLDRDSIDLIRQALFRFLSPDAILIETSARRPPWVAAGTRILPNDWSVETTTRTEATKNLQLKHTASPLPQQHGDEGCSQEMVTVKGLSFQYPKSGFSIGPLDLSANAGECIAIVGPNGAGKTTLLKSLALLLQPQFDTLRIGGIEPDHKRLHEWAKVALYNFQRADDQIYLPTVAKEMAETAWRLGRAVAPERLTELARCFGLESALDHPPFDLPNPKRRLMTIAASLLAQPPVLLLDEPTACLDETQFQSALKLLQAYILQGGTLFLVSHDAALLDGLATRFITLCPDGKVMEAA
jgi:energy-coupling factor transporter ATP-binding protein EcfA2